MKNMTSAYANKMIKSLEEDKSYWLSKESSSSTYTAALGEEAMIPDYDYEMVSRTIEEIDQKICILKHAINLNNALAKIEVGDKLMSVDQILVRMAQLNRRKETLDHMRKIPEKSRVSAGYARPVTEFSYINFDPAIVRADYEKISEETMVMQMALDRYNQTFIFEVNI